MAIKRQLGSSCVTIRDDSPRFHVDSVLFEGCMRRYANTPECSSHIVRGRLSGENGEPTQQKP